MLGAIVLVIIIGAIVEELGKKEKTTTIYKYKRKNTPMTRIELAYFLKIKKIIPSNYYIFPQVHLSAILEHKLSGQNWKGAFAKINGKSVDFAIYDDKLNLICAIEIDDYTHSREDRKERDKFVNTVLSDCDIVLYRFKSFKDLDNFAI